MCPLCHIYALTLSTHKLHCFTVQSSQIHAKGSENMQNRLEKPSKVSLSLCDNTSRMGIVGIFNTCMDLATEHGDMLGLGMAELAKKDLIWLAVKTKIKIIRRPDMLQSIVSSTWPLQPEKVRCNRCYLITDKDGNTLIEGKTEWAMLNIKTGRPSKADGIFPEELIYFDKDVCGEGFFRLSTDFTDCETLGSHTATSSDIDVSQHMNNVAYVRAVLGAFSTREVEDMDISEMEIAYRLQCFEGENLTLRKRTAENGMEIGVIKQDGKTAAVVRITCKQ